MIMAIDEAARGMSSGDGGPFGVVIAREGEVIARAHNTVLKDNNATHHAEILAISEASSKLKAFDLSGCTIYTTTEPCPMCFSAIHWARIDKIVYGTEISDVKALGFNELTISAQEMKERSGSRLNIISGFMLEECQELLKAWQAMPNKQTY